MTWARRGFWTAVLAGSVAASAVAGEGDRLLHSITAAGIIGAALLVASIRKQFSPKIWFTVALVSIGAAMATLIVHQSTKDLCTTTNASGQRVVIGTELTDDGKEYQRLHPTEGPKQVLESLGELPPTVAWTTESVRQCRLKLALSASWIPLFGVAAIAAGSLTGLGASKRGVQSARLKPRVFISYNHDDSATALALKQLLERSDIDVIIDADAMAPGERISDFIQRSTRDCDVVLSVISCRSLLSAWVASETIGSINRNKWGQEVRLIACYLDDEWFAPEFRLGCTRQIDDRLKRIEELIPEYAAKKIDTVDLNEEKTRLYDLRNNLGTILATFKDSLCLDVRDGQFDKSGERLVATIRSKRGA
jgi:hypothetical protein